MKLRLRTGKDTARGTGFRLSDGPAMLKTARLIRRRWQEADSEPFARMNADPRVMAFIPCLLGRTESDALIDRVEQHFEDKGFGLYAAELRKNHLFLGFVRLMVPHFAAHFTPNVEIG